MKTKCTTILKVTTALVLAVLMMVGSVSSVVGAVTEQAEARGDLGSGILAKAAIAGASAALADDDDDVVVGKKAGSDLAAAGANVDLAATGWAKTAVYGSWQNWSSANSVWIADGDEGSAIVNTGAKAGDDVYFRFRGTNGSDFSTATFNDYGASSNNDPIAESTGYGLTHNTGNSLKYTVKHSGILKFTLSKSNNTFYGYVDECRYQLGWETYDGNTGHYNSANNPNLVYQGNNKYTTTVNLTAGVKYRFYVRSEYQGTNGKEYVYFKNTVEMSDDTDITLYKYGTNNANAVTYTPSVTGEHTFTWDCSSWQPDTAQFKVTPPVGTNFYLRGYLNNANHTENDLQFTKVNDNKYTLTGWAPTYDHGGYQYATIWDGTNAYHPTSHPASSGAAATDLDSDPSDDAKWKVAAINGQTVDFTWERADSSSNWTLSWTVSGGSSSGSWKYTDNHNDATPEWTNSPGDYRFVWANNDDGPGKSGTTAIVPGKDSDHGYWADITSYCKSNSSFYFALSNNSSNSGIRGNKQEQINDVAKSAGNTVTMTNGSNETIFYVEMKERSSVSGSAYFILVRGVDWTKISAIGVQAYDNNNSYTDYKFYYKEKGSGDEEVTEATLYAKDGAIVIDWDHKGNSGASTTSGTAYGFSAVADTTFTKIGGTTVSTSGTTITSNTEWKDGASVDDDGASYETAKIAAGKTIKLTTTIDATRRSKYYVKGWSINGTTYKCDGTAGVNAASATSTDTGVCELTYTIPSKLKTDIIEITPIYYQRLNSNCVTFYLEGYNTVQESWGTTPYIYPFYGNLNNIDNSFGVYPGQPMVYANGQYSIEIPMTNTRIDKADGDTAIKGITINNGYADHVHRNLVYMWSDHDNDADHKQTYDYDDFAKIYYECLKDGEHPNSIIFRIQDESKVFNRAQYGGGKSGQFASGTDGITLSNIESTGNGWELLTNRYGEPINLFGEVQNTVPDSYSTDISKAVYVVSTGYNANIAGDYGTMWKVYNGSGQLISNNGGRQGIPPSLLLLNGSSTEVNPNGSAHYLDANREVDGVGSYTDKHSDYYDVYKALKEDCADKIVYITYEQNTQDTRKVNTGTGADRVDGRWYYTHAADYVQSNIEIECYDKSTGEWIAETPAAATGLGNSGNTASFDSDSYKSSSEQTTSSKVLISSNSTWNFTANAGTGYMFDSWQIKYSETSYDKMDGTGAAGSIPATANYTLVARFMPVVTGELTITHALSNSSTGEGTVNMTVTQGGTPRTVTVTNGVARTNLTVSNSESSQVITVTLTATPLYDGKVNSFGYDRQLTLLPAATEANLNTKATAATSTFSFTVAQLYAGTTQTITDLAYTSLIEPTPHYYSFTYNFASRGSYNNDMSYTAKGEISLRDYKNNVTGSHEISDAFVKSMAPFESNFLKKLTLGSISKNYDSANDTFTATASYTSADSIPTYNVTFKLPYEYRTDSGAGYKKYNATAAGTYNASKPTFDLLAKYNEFVTIGATDTTTGAQENVDKITDSSDTNHTGNNFITAPDQLTSGSTTYYFRYWEIKKKTDTGQANAPLISRIYYPDFHYRIFGDYYVEAIYSTTEADSWHHHYSGDQGYNCSIIYLGDSRNQWNNGGGSTSSGTDTEKAAVAADKIYNDFIFSYNDNGAELKGQTKDLGMILERVSYLDTSDNTRKWAVGNANVTDMSTYQDTYGVAGQKEDIATWLGSGGSAPTGVLPKIAWNTSELNNKNYTEQNYSFYSAYGQKVEDHSITFNTDSTVDNFVYRAYAYMKGSDGTYYVSDPVYFCMRYTANLNYTE